MSENEPNKRHVPRPSRPSDYLLERRKIYLQPRGRGVDSTAATDTKLPRTKKPSLFSRYKTKQSQKKLQKSSSVNKSHTVNKNKTVSTPKLKSIRKPKFSLKIPNRRLLLISGLVGLVVLAGGILSIHQLRSSKSKLSTITSGKTTTVLAKTDVKPSFTLVLPGGKSLESVGGVKLVSPENSPPAYAFIDTLEDVKINVSQQELPESFKSDPAAKLEAVAKDFQATDVIQIDGVKTFYGYSEKSKVESLILIKKGKLVFIKSPVKLSNDTWAGYITSLQ